MLASKNVLAVAFDSRPLRTQACADSLVESDEAAPALLSHPPADVVQLSEGHPEAGDVVARMVVSPLGQSWRKRRILDSEAVVAVWGV